MSNEILTNVACPNCLNPIDVREHGRHVTCDACSSQFILIGHLCPNCSAYNEKEASLCGQCGTALTRICRKCKTTNWAGDEYCSNCSNAMDILDLVAGNYLTTTAERLLEQRMQAQQLQAVEEESSNRRWGELMEMEKVRQTEIQRRLKKQKAQERTTFVVLGVIATLFILFLIGYVLLSFL